MVNHLGLTEVLTGACDLESAIRQTSVEGLFFLSAGHFPPNPSELLGADKMKDTLSQAVEQYDYVIVDSPPVGLVSDAILLSTMTDGVIFVVRSGSTPKPAVKNAIARLEYARAKIFGIALNRVNIHPFDSANDYYYGGSHGYRGESRPDDAPVADPLH